MKKFSNLLEVAVKPVSSLATIAVGLSIISFAAVSIKDNFSALLPSCKKKIRAVVCIKKVNKEEQPKNEESVKLDPSKKVVEPDMEEPRVETGDESDSLHLKNPEPSPLKTDKSTSGTKKTTK